jgi:hypothetical protein
MMMTLKLSLSLLLMTGLACVMPTLAQDATFADVNVLYSFGLPDAKWKMTVKPSATSTNVEYVYGDRFDGHLEVRKLTVPTGDTLPDIVRSEEQKLQFRLGFVASREENFVGRLKGSVYNFEYVAAGRSMSGRFYFVRANDTTVYLLRFSGQRDSLRTIRSQTDSIARTFGIK